MARKFKIVKQHPCTCFDSQDVGEVYEFSGFWFGRIDCPSCNKDMGPAKLYLEIEGDSVCELDRIIWLPDDEGQDTITHDMRIEENV